MFNREPVLGKQLNRRTAGPVIELPCPEKARHCIRIILAFGTHSPTASLSRLVSLLQLRRAYMGAGYGDSSSSSSSDYEDRDYVVPRGRLLEDYQRLALHTERHLNGEAKGGGG